MSATFDPFAPAFRADPHPALHRLRALEPVHRSGRGHWVVTRYRDVVRVLRGREFSRRLDLMLGHASLSRYVRENPALSMRAGWMLFRDPPDHTRLRALVQQAFTPRRVAAARPIIDRTVRELLAAGRRAGGMDVIADLAEPLPVTVIAHVLGIPPEDLPAFRAWTRDLVGVLEPADDPGRLARANAAAVAFTDYLTALIAERRRTPAPGEDLVTALVAAEARGDILSERELVDMCTLLVVAGHQTTAHFIGNAIHTLLRHPAELERLRHERTLDEPAIEELLRFEGPVISTGRIAAEDIRLDGTMVHRGEELTLVLAAANRDPEQFPEPDRLDLSRDGGRHVAFGAGIHTCLGAQLARFEAGAAIRALLDAWPSFRRRRADVVWRDTVGLRGLESLELAL